MNGISGIFSAQQPVLPKFSGAKEFAQQTQISGGQTAVETHLPTLLDELDLGPVVTNLGGLERVSLLHQLQSLVEKARTTLLHLGTVEQDQQDWVITSFADGKAVETRFPVTNRQLVMGPETDVNTFMTQALGPQPRVIINPVGWTIPDPQMLIDYNPVAASKADELRQSLVDSLGETHPDLDTKYKKGLKIMAGQYYEAAFKQFWEPILNYLFDDLKLPVNQFAFLTSASYDGVDKAAMDFGESRGIDVVNITPFTYAEWMDTSKSYPLLVTNSVDDYAEACAKAANFLFVTGGRAHAWQRDVKNFMIGEKKAVVPVDIMQDVLGFSIPAVNGNDVENAARVLIDRGLDIRKTNYAQNIRQRDTLTQTQQQVAGILLTLYAQYTGTDPQAIAASLTP